MTLEQQVANLVTATTDLTGVVNTELDKVRSENTDFKATVVSKAGSTMHGNLTVPKIVITDQSSNTFFGHNSGLLAAPNFLSGTGTRNAGFGNNVLAALTVGACNTVLGSSSTRHLVSGSCNTAIGQDSLSLCIDGDSNTAVGNGSLISCLGGENTGVGLNSLSALTTFNNCVGLGSTVQVTGDNQVQIGNERSSVYIYGTTQNRSDLRDKTDVRPTLLGLSFVK